MVSLKFNSTADIKVPKRIVDQVIGQDEAVQVIKKASQQRRHVLLIGDPGTGKCVGKDTEIISDQGPIKAESLFKSLQKYSIEITKETDTYLLPTKEFNLYTLDDNGKVTKKAIKAAYKGIRKKAIKITTAGGSEFVLSGEHPILTIKNNRLTFLPSEELKEGCFIGTARKIPESDNITFPKEKLKNLRVEKNKAQFIGRNGVKSLTLTVPEVISKELAYFLGICTAEARWQGNFIIYNSDNNIKEFIIDTLIKEFDYPREFILELKTGIFLRKSRTFVQILSSCFDFPLETTQQSSKKKVPSAMYSCNNNLIYYLLCGLIDGDGQLGKRGFELTSSSKELIYGISILFLKLGIQSRIGKSLKHASNTESKIKRPYFRIAIYDLRNIIDLFENLKLFIGSKREGVKFFKDKKFNTNVDIVPSIGKQLCEIKKELNVSFEDLDEHCATFFKLSHGKRNISRSLAQRIITKFKDFSITGSQNNLLLLENNDAIMNLDLVVNSDVFWDRIKSMNLIEDDTYDFEIEDTHNFLVSAGIIVHNSMLGLALAELLPMEKLVDIIAFPNPNDENMPLIRTIPAGQGRDLVMKARLQSMTMFKNQNIIVFILVILAMFAPWWVRSYYKSDIMFAAFFLGGMVFLAAFVIFLNLGKRVENKVKIPRLIVDNFKRKQAPFNDATGAHAGALLGDVLHDPFQSFNSSNKIIIIDGKNNQKSIPVSELVDSLIGGRKKNILRKGTKNYEAIFLSKNELLTLGETHGLVSPVEVLSANRYDCDVKMIKLTTAENKEIVVTQGHKIAVNRNGKIDFVEAKSIKEGDDVFCKADYVIIGEQDIINTYSQEQQHLAKSYYQYLELKQQHPSWGYKKIATKLGVTYGRTRWWWEKNSAPVPVQTIEYLKNKGLLPLKIDNPKLPLIAKVLGATFGDGGIFENLNGLFLSSSEKSAVEEFGNDLIKIFCEDIKLNSRIIKGGVEGHSWCYQNTNRNIIRFFKALEAPIGSKTKIKLIVPEWIRLNYDLEDEFYGSLFGGEIGISSSTLCGARLEFGITGIDELNRFNFLNQIVYYLNRRGIEITGKIYSYERKTNKDSKIFRFVLSQNFDNCQKFVKNVKINYCEHKKKKLVEAINEFGDLKKSKFNVLISRGHGAESAMRLLNLSQSGLYNLLNEGTVKNEA